MDDINKWKFFPWENGEKPVLVNEEGFEWYLDKDCTQWATKWMGNNNPPLKANCFFAKRGEEVTRVLIDKNQNILHHDTSLEGMCAKIDVLRLLENYDR